MAVVRFNTPLKQTILADILAALSTGRAKAKFYTGSMLLHPETPTVAPVNKLLGTLLCTTAPGAAVTTVADGDGAIVSLVFSPIETDAVADDTGTAGFVRLTTSADVAIADLNTSATGGGGAVTMNTTSVVVGGPISCQSFVVTIG